MTTYQHAAPPMVYLDADHSTWLDDDAQLYAALCVSRDGQADAVAVVLDAATLDAVATGGRQVHLAMPPDHERTGRLPADVRRRLWRCTYTRPNGSRCRNLGTGHTGRCHHHPHGGPP